ncbi:hypothetical protein D3C73_800600 [compost metagenome]
MSGEGEKGGGLLGGAEFFKVGEAFTSYFQSSDFVKLGKAVQALSKHKTLSQIGLAGREMAERTALIAKTMEGHSIGRIAQGLSSNSFRMFDLNSELGRTVAAISKFNSLADLRGLNPGFGQRLGLYAPVVGAALASANQTVAEFIASNADVLELLDTRDVNLDRFVDGVGEASDISRATLSEALVSPEREGLKSEIVNAILKGGDFSVLSSQSLRYLFFLLICIQLALSAFNQFAEAQKNYSAMFAKAETPAEARAQARRTPLGVAREQLSGFRVLVGDDVQLREGPGKKYLAFESPKIGSLLQVLDSSNKSWILVSVIIDDEPVEGWILRKYAKKIR